MSEQNEVLRLVSELIHAAHGTVLNEDQSREDEARAALLDAIGGEPCTDPDGERSMARAGLW